MLAKINPGKALLRTGKKIIRFHRLKKQGGFASFLEIKSEKIRDLVSSWTRIGTISPHLPVAELS
jgi:hypothetical protein